MVFRKEYAGHCFKKLHYFLKDEQLNSLQILNVECGNEPFITLINSIKNCVDPLYGLPFLKIENLRGPTFSM